jgi:replicative DNA helicase
MSYIYQDMVLGAVMAYHDKYWPSLKPLWNPEVFLEIERIKIATIIKNLADSNQTVCLPLIIDALKGEGTFLAERLYQSAPLQMNIDWMMSKMVDWYNIKKNIPDVSHVLHQIVNAKINDKAEELLNDLKNATDKMLKASTDQTNCFGTRDILESTIEKVLDRINNKDSNDKFYIKTNIQKLDDSITGFKGGRFYIIAARPSVGKTSFATHVCFEAMKQGKKPLFFSNEMSKEEIMEKMITSVSGIPNHKLQTGDLNDFQQEELTNAINALGKMDLLIDEQSGWSLDQLISTVHKKHVRGECDLVFVDYLQQVRVPKSLNKTEQVSIVSDAMKKLSRDLNIPVIGLAQINRESEKTNGKDMAPSLVHIKDSGSLEQDADVVFILHRPEVNDSENITNIDLKLAKNRHGKVGTTNLKFHHFVCRYTAI